MCWPASDHESNTAGRAPSRLSLATVAALHWHMPLCLSLEVIAVFDTLLQLLQTVHISLIGILFSN